MKFKSSLFPLCFVLFLSLLATPLAQAGIGALCDVGPCDSDADCAAVCGTCWTCVGGPGGVCTPQDSICQDMTGGLAENVCRIGVCLDAFLPDNPTGCDYSIDPASTNAQCTLCSAPIPPNQPNCGDGACEPDLGENCNNCTIDCLVPGFDLACPRDSTGVSCATIPQITFGGPPYNTPDAPAICEDGDVCTTNACVSVGGAQPTCAAATPITACGGAVSDLCCPAGCLPFSPNDPNCATAPNCDIDCLPPEYCPFCGNDIVDPGEACDGTATNGQCTPDLCNTTCQCIPPVNPPCHVLEGSGLFGSAVSDPNDCDGWSCSLGTQFSGGHVGTLGMGFCLMLLLTWRVTRRVFARE